MGERYAETTMYPGEGKGAETEGEGEQRRAERRREREYGVGQDQVGWEKRISSALVSGTWASRAGRAPGNWTIPVGGGWLGISGGSGRPGAEAGGP